MAARAIDDLEPVNFGSLQRKAERFPFYARLCRGAPVHRDIFPSPPENQTAAITADETESAVIPDGDD